MTKENAKKMIEIILSSRMDSKEIRMLLINEIIDSISSAEKTVYIPYQPYPPYQPIQPNKIWYQDTFIYY